MLPYLLVSRGGLVHRTGLEYNVNHVIVELLSEVSQVFLCHGLYMTSDCSKILSILESS